MARTESKMLPLGTPAPDFILIDAVTNNPVSLKDIRGPKGTVVMFICNHCPYVKHVAPTLARIHRSGGWRASGLRVPNAAAWTPPNEHHPRSMSRDARDRRRTCPLMRTSPGSTPCCVHVGVDDDEAPQGPLFPGSNGPPVVTRSASMRWPRLNPPYSSYRASRVAAGCPRRAPGTTRSRRCWWRGRRCARGSWR